MSRVPELLAQVAQTFLPFVGVVIGLAYPIGFIAFWIQLWRYFEYDSLTALYTTATVPLTVLTGNLINVLKSLFFSGGIALAVFTFSGMFFTEIEEGQSRKVNLTGTGGLIGLFLLLGPEALSWVGVYSVQGVVDYLWYGLYIVCAFGGGLLGGYLALRDPSRWGLIRAKALVYLAAIVGALVLSGLQILSLPVVELGSESKPVFLVSHSEGYWYVFDHEGRLTAISDEEAGRVRFVRE